MRVGLAADAQVLVSLRLQVLDEIARQLGLGLVAGLAYRARAHEFRNDSAFVGKRNRLVAIGRGGFGHGAAFTQCATSCARKSSSAMPSPPTSRVRCGSKACTKAPVPA